jgi:hypothetical protein
MFFFLQIIGLRIDVHEKSSIASSKYTVAEAYVETLCNMDILKSKYC